MAAVFSLLATAVSGSFAASLLTRWRRRRARPLLYWGISLVMFCLASAMLALGVLAGWNSAVFRTFYLFGAVLNVPWLALGSVVVNAPSATVSRWTGGLTVVVAALLGWAATGSSPLLFVPGVVLGALWGLLQLTAGEEGLEPASTALIGVFTAVGAFAVTSVTLRGPVPASGLPEGSELFGEAVRGIALAGNAVGATIVVLGALVSVVHLGWGSADDGTRDTFRREGRRAPVAALAGLAWRASRALRRARLTHLAAGNLMIALGVLLAAAGGMFSFLGDTAGHAVGLGLGVSVMFLGFVRTTRPAPVRDDPDPAGRDPRRRRPAER